MRYKLEEIFGMGGDYETLKTKIKKKGVTWIGYTGREDRGVLNIQVRGPKYYNNSICLTERESVNLLNSFPEAILFEDLEGKPVLAVYNGRNLTGIQKRDES